MTAPAHDPHEYATAAGLDPARLPRHVAVIMDGNGRWAAARGEPRAAGHAEGADTVRATVTECRKLGIDQLTLYCFSAENWKRPAAEVALLMDLLQAYLVAEREQIVRENIRFRVIGRRDGLPAGVLADIDANTQVSSANTGMTLCLAINYGGRAEIVDAVNVVVRRVIQGAERGKTGVRAGAETVTEADIEAALYTAGMPDPDLLIRTAGEMRVSNYLLWQISYAEIWVTPLCWPDFSIQILHRALRDFASRDRRFGGLHNVRGAADAP